MFKKIYQRIERATDTSSMEDFETELKLDFLEESVEILEDAENAFLALENNKEDKDLMDQIFRVAHNLKGTAAAVGFEKLSNLTHTAENLILMIKEDQLGVTDEIVTALLAFKDKVSEIIAGLKSDLNFEYDIEECKNLLAKHSEPQGEQDNNASEETNSEEEIESVPDNEGEFEDIELSSDQVKEEEEPAAQESSAEVNEKKPVEINAAALESLKELGLMSDSDLAQLEQGNGSEAPSEQPKVEAVEEKKAAPLEKEETAPQRDQVE